MISRREFEILADYHQFYLEDENSPHETGDIWNQKTAGDGRRFDRRRNGTKYDCSRNN